MVRALAQEVRLDEGLVRRTLEEMLDGVAYVNAGKGGAERAASPLAMALGMGKQQGKGRCSIM